MTPELSGVRVLVTRPTHQQADFNNLLHQLGALPRALACLEIHFDAAATAHQLDKLEDGQIIIFTSTNAVQAVHEVLPLPWSEKRYTVLAIGTATARLLQQLGLPPSSLPQPPYNSEALLQLEALSNVELKKISIIKGHGGRALLADTLKGRAKTVESICVYERKKPHVTQKTLDAIFLKSGVDIVTITSNEALKNLVEISSTTHKEQLLSLPLVVNSQRCARLANDLCFQSQILVADEPGNAGQLAALKLWNRSYRSKL